MSGTSIAGPLRSPSLPFAIAIGPEQAVAHHGWAEARDRVLSAVLAGPSLVLVLGAPGTGKTLLLQELARTLRADGTDVMLQPRGDLPIDAAEVGAERRRVVLIDEADRMNEAALERLGRLGECAFVLAGMPDPGEDRPGGPSTAAMTVVRLSALPPDEVGAFVAARLAESGLDADMLSSEAVARLAEHSGGMPRVLNMLAGAALFLARAERAPRVEAAHVDQAAALRDGDAWMGAAGPAAPIVPRIIPCQQAKPSPSRVAERPASSLAAAALPPVPLGRGQERRWEMAAMGVVIGVAAACGGLVAWHDDHVQRASPLMAAAPSAPAPLDPVASVPQPRASPAPPPETTVAQADVGTAERGTGAQDASPSPVPLPEPVAPSSAMPEPAPPPMAAAPPQPEASASGAPARVAVPEPPPLLMTAAAPRPEAPTDAPAHVAVPEPAPPPMAAAPPQPEALPTDAPAHVAVRYTRGNAGAAARAASVALTLRAAGFAVDTPLSVSRRDARPGAHYFFAEDQGAAEAVLRAVGLPGKGSLAGPAGLNAVPRPGLIELIVPPGEVEAGGRLRPPDPGRS